MIDPDDGLAERPGPEKRFFGRLFNSIGSVFSSSPSEKTYDEGTLIEFFIQGKGLTKERLAEPVSETWHLTSAFLNGRRLAEFKNKEYVINANGFAVKQNHLLKSEATEVLTFFMGGAEQKGFVYIYWN